MDIPQTTEKKLYKGKPAPLICWDIYLDYFSKQKSKIEDINFLEKFLHNKSCPFLNDWKTRFEYSDTTVITNPEQIIQWVSSGFLQMTGYTKNEAINRKPTFLQGDKTDLKTKQIIRKKLKGSKPAEENLINYRKSGGEYLCHLEIVPIYNQNKKLVNFIAFERKIG